MNIVCRAFRAHCPCLGTLEADYRLCASCLDMISLEAHVFSYMTKDGDPLYCPHKVKTQIVRFRLHATYYFLLPVEDSCRNWQTINALQKLRQELPYQCNLLPWEWIDWKLCLIELLKYISCLIFCNFVVSLYIRQRYQHVLMTELFHS